MDSTVLDRRAAHATAPKVPLETVWEALSSVPDPEIPVVSIVELGIVRSVIWTNGMLRVLVTPTYSGCPATDVIRADIGNALRNIGVGTFAIETALSPAWTTDWIAPEAKEKLRSFGIAPPGVNAARISVAGISPLRRKGDVPCPHCGSTTTSLVAQFGSTACKALYRCDSCREPFDYFKPF